MTGRRARVRAPAAGEPAPPPLVLGTRPAPGYEILRHLTRRGWLDLYDTWSEERACRCVVKVVRPDRRDEAVPRARLLRECRWLCAFGHPHLVRAYETLEWPEPLVEGTADGDHHRCPLPEVSASPVGSRRRLPRALAAAIDRCLGRDPSTRPTVTELAASLGAIFPAYGPRMPYSGSPGAGDVATFPRPTRSGWWRARCRRATSGGRRTGPRGRRGSGRPRTRVPGAG